MVNLKRSRKNSIEFTDNVQYFTKLVLGRVYSEDWKLSELCEEMSGNWLRKNIMIMPKECTIFS